MKGNQEKKIKEKKRIKKKRKGKKYNLQISTLKRQQS